MDYYYLPLYILFGILPSLAWLFYYLSRDSHPEPKRMILKVFFYGVLITIPAFLTQVWLSGALNFFDSMGFFSSFGIIPSILKWFLIIALIEEFLKFIVVKKTVFKNKELDEPIDVMLYMIVVALGFAAAENILYLFSPTMSNSSFISAIGTAFSISFMRFIGATFLHTLSSGILGYFLALSFYRVNEKLKLTIIGLLLATLLHGLYNFSIIVLEGPINFIMPVVIVIASSMFLLKAFVKVKKLKSISEV